MAMARDTNRGRRAPARKPSGRFLLRLDPGLHALVRAAAAEAGLSLNDYCARRLAASIGEAPTVGPAAVCVERAARLFGDRLLGVVLYGSWARGEAADDSDIDLLVVLDEEIPLRRELYRTWDDRPITWEGRRIEVHFAHLPKARRAPGGLWAEVALDGIVLFERALTVSRRLSAVRRAILAGQIVRRTAQGQPYWVEVA